MCPQSMAALIMQHSLYCVTHHHRFSMSFAWSLSRRWKRKCTFYILLVARILLDMYSIVLSCGCFEPKSQKYQVTLLSFFFYPPNTLQTTLHFAKNIWFSFCLSHHDMYFEAKQLGVGWLYYWAAHNLYFSDIRCQQNMHFSLLLSYFMFSFGFKLLAPTATYDVPL